MRLNFVGAVAAILFRIQLTFFSETKSTVKQTLYSERQQELYTKDSGNLILY